MGLFDSLQIKKRPKTGGLYTPKYIKKTATNGASISDDSINRINEDLTAIRYGADQKEVVRKYAKVQPDLSHSLNNYIRFILTDSFTLKAVSLETGVIDTEATKAAQSFVLRLNNLPPDYTGFRRIYSFSSLGETMLAQLLCNGCAMGELVFDKSLMPSHIQAVSTNALKWEQKGKLAKPYLDQGQEKIYLDSPAVQLISLNQDPDSAYSDGWMESAIQAIIASEQYRGDIRKAFRKAALPRTTAEINEEKFRESLAPEVLYDEAKLQTAMEGVITSVTDQLTGLNPEDALAMFDTVKVSVLSPGNTSTHDSLKEHAAIINGMLSTGLKTLPSMLGRGESQSTASTESVLFLKVCEGLQGRLNELISSLLTLAMRVNGHDVVVKYEYEKPNLRPDLELESFKTVKQSRVLEQLSLGLISDDEASLALTGELPSGDFTPLSGTGFHKAGGGGGENLYSNTSVTPDGVDNTKVQKDQKPKDQKPKTTQTAG